MRGRGWGVMWGCGEGFCCSASQYGWGRGGVVELGTPRPGTECSRALRARNPKRVRKESERVSGASGPGKPQIPRRVRPGVRKESKNAASDSFWWTLFGLRGALFGDSGAPRGRRCVCVCPKEHTHTGTYTRMLHLPFSDPLKRAGERWAGPRCLEALGEEPKHWQEKSTLGCTPKGSYGNTAF